VFIWIYQGHAGGIMWL